MAKLEGSAFGNFSGRVGNLSQELRMVRLLLVLVLKSSMFHKVLVQLKGETDFLYVPGLQRLSAI